MEYKTILVLAILLNESVSTGFPLNSLESDDPGNNRKSKSLDLLNFLNSPKGNNSQWKWNVNVLSYEHNLKNDLNIQPPELRLQKQQPIDSLSPVVRTFSNVSNDGNLELWLKVWIIYWPVEAVEIRSTFLRSSDNISTTVETVTRDPNQEVIFNVESLGQGNSVNVFRALAVLNNLLSHLKDITYEDLFNLPPNLGDLFNVFKQDLKSEIVTDFVLNNFTSAEFESSTVADIFNSSTTKPTMKITENHISGSTEDTPNAFITESTSSTTSVLSTNSLTPFPLSIVSSRNVLPPEFVRFSSTNSVPDSLVVSAISTSSTEKSSTFSSENFAGLFESESLTQTFNNSSTAIITSSTANSSSFELENFTDLIESENVTTVSSTEKYISSTVNSADILPIKLTNMVNFTSHFEDSIDMASSTPETGNFSSLETESLFESATLTEKALEPSDKSFVTRFELAFKDDITSTESSFTHFNSEISSQESFSTETNPNTSTSPDNLNYIEVTTNNISIVEHSIHFQTKVNINLDSNSSANLEKNTNTIVPTTLHSYTTQNKPLTFSRLPQIFNAKNLSTEMPNTSDRLKSIENSPQIQIDKTVVLELPTILELYPNFAVERSVFNFNTEIGDPPGETFNVKYCTSAGQCNWNLNERCITKDRLSFCDCGRSYYRDPVTKMCILVRIWKNFDNSYSILLPKVLPI